MKKLKHSRNENVNFLGSLTKSLKHLLLKSLRLLNYLFRPLEEYAAIKITEFNELTRTEGNVTQVYYDIFRIKDEGWYVTRTK